MISYLLAVLAILIVWKINALLKQDLLQNFSKTSVPYLKNSFNLTVKNTEGMFKFSREAAQTFGRSYQMSFFGILGFNITRGRDAEKVLGSSKHNDKSFIYNFIHPFLKTGLLTSSGEKWHKRRRLLTPAFHFDILKEFFVMFKEESDRLVESLKLETGKSLNIIPVSTQFTLNAICESAMGVKLSELGNDGVTYRNRIYTIGYLMMHRLMRPWLHLDLFYSLLGYRRELDSVLKPVHDFTKSIIEQRRLHFESDKKNSDAGGESENVYLRSKKRRYAMMDTLLQAQRDGQIDDAGIMEETDTFTFEGHDTTSAAMTFTLLLLAHHPEAQEGIFEEIQEFLSKSDETELTMDDFNKMEYLERVIKESMRIYPPVPFISREFSEDFVHDGVTHPKGTSFNVHIYDIHRDPEVFPEPEKFDPDRFLPENCANRSNFAYIAFSAGMRNCIGQRFALLELKVMLTKVVQNFKLFPITQRDEVVFIADIVLRCSKPIKMKLQLRNN